MRVDNRRYGAGLILLMLALTLSNCRGDTSEKAPIHVNPNMDTQKKVLPQWPDPFFTDGRGMRPLLRGTVSVGHLKTDNHLYRGTVNGKWATTLPQQFKLSEAFVERGRERFEIFCTPCHDSLGTGNGRVHRLNVGMLQPADLHMPRLQQEGIGYFYHMITNGKRTATGSYTMMRMRSQIPVRDRWAIATYLRLLQRSQHQSAK